MMLLKTNPVGKRRILSFITMLAATALASPASPNIVFILADDMGYGDPHHAGGIVPTPAIDRLAAEGMRFTDAHTTSSVCTPTRYSIMTGRYNWRSTLKKGVLGGFGAPLISPKRPTVASFLADAGYQTAVIGKWHLGLGWEKLPDSASVSGEGRSGPGWDIDYGRQVARGPVSLGFQESFILPASLDVAPYVYLRNDKPVEIPTVTKAWDRPGPSTPSFDAGNCLRDWAGESRAFIRRAVEKDKPFFLYLPLTSPHTPVLPAERWRGKSPVGPYGDFLMETDWVVGEILAELDSQGITRDTLVIFTSDNGCAPSANIPGLVEKGQKPNGDLRGTKSDIWEGGHREPFVVRWPAQVAAGSVCDTTISSADLFATAAEITGKSASIPADAAEDSFSIIPLLTRTGTYQRGFAIHHSENGSFAIRQGDWKLCLCPDSGGWSQPNAARAEADKLHPVQLYNLKSDPGEKENLAEKEPETVKRLAALFAKAVSKGRTTPGPEQRNDGNIKPFNKRVTELLPELTF